MKDQNRFWKLPASLAFGGLILAGTPALAQEAQPVPVEPVIAPAPQPPVVEPVPVPETTAAPAPAGDSVAPEALEEIAQETAAVAPPAKSAPQSRTAAPTRAVAPAPAADPAIATDDGGQAAAAAADAAIANPADVQEVTPAEEPAVIEEATPAGDIDGETWLIAAGITGALGLAAAGTVLARRRRKDGVAERAPSERIPPLSAAASATAAPTAEPAQPVFARTAAVAPEPMVREPRYVAPTAQPGITDPLFARKVVAPPVTDPLFMRKVDLPPVTDPLFAHHRDYAGPGAAKPNIGWNRSMAPAGNATGIPLAEVGKPIRQLEPAE